MQCGAAVVAGNRTSLPEVVGPAGLLVDPFDVSALAAGIARLVDEPGLRERLRVAGRERARQFTWRETAARTLKAYERAVGGNDDCGTLRDE